MNNKTVAVRPAFNLNLSDVLFTSAATGGKSASGMDSGLTAVQNYSGNDWKLTLKDSTRSSFAISNAKWSGNTLTFSYSGAQTGTNEYLSAVILENGAITCYGRILQLTSASGTASLSLPSGVTLSDTTTLYVFNEQVNDAKRTDYASALSPIPAPAAEQPPVVTTTTLNVQESVEVPPTGDSSQMGLWFGLALLSFAGLAACATLWRRKRAS